MKIAISSDGKGLNSLIDPRFGRCAYFIIVETDDGSYKAFENTYKSLSGGSGIQVAGFLQSKNVETVLTGKCGPNAMNVFSESKIKVMTGLTGSIENVLTQFKTGSLTPSAQPSVGETTGWQGSCGQANTGSRSQGRCIGGSGRGMGGGGRGMGGRGRQPV